MKHFLLVLVLLVGSLGTMQAQSNALKPQPEQEAPLTTFADSINRVFQYVDKSRVPSGILEEYGLQFINHVPFTGTNGYSADNQLDINRWRALYGDLYGARINTTAQSMTSLARANQQLRLYASDAYVELPILHFIYHSIRTDALRNGRIQSVNNRLYDVAGQNPYEANSAFAVAADNAQLASASPAFVFRPDLFWTNTGRTVASLQADFADGSGFVAMSWNTAQLVNYSSAGPKDVRVRIGYTDGSIYENHLLVVSPEPVAEARYAGSPSVAPFVLTATKAYNGQQASAHISIEYGGLHKTPADAAVLDKPLIVVKGFDVSGIIQNIPRSTYSSFADAISTVENKGILSDGADLDGYDIVYVDFDNGTDYMQRNAYLLETVIKWVNDNKTGTQPNAILAMSMGGLIAQYALCDIERDIRNGVSGVAPHQVRLLITHDSPHQGANVPLSVQFAVRHLAGLTIRAPFGNDFSLVDQLPVLGQARDALLSPAAQQLLRYQTARLPTRTLFGAVFAGPVIAAQTSLYDTFQQEYQALLGPSKVPVGTPGLPCRVVAVANGSECGRGQPFEPYAEFVHFGYEGEIFNFPLGQAIVASGLAVIAGVGFVAPVLLGLSGAYDITIALELNALPDQQAKQIYSAFAEVNKRTRVFGLFKVQVDLVNFQGFSLSSMLPLDSGSGGIISLAAYAQQLGSTAATLPAGLIKQQQFCFTPTYSTLNITPTSSAALRAQYSPGTNVGTPFANFRTAARENEQHIEFTALNSTWMLKELRQTPQVLSCQDFCQAMPSLNGPSAICASGATYSINGLPTGTTVAWQLATTASVSATSYVGSTFTVSSTGTAGVGTLTATLTSDCGELSLSMLVSIGAPEAPIIVIDEQDDCNHVAHLRIDNYSPALQYTVSGSGAGGRAGATFFVKNANYTVTVTNTCGTAATSGTIMWGECPGPTAGYTVYPNPADDNLTVEQTDSSAATGSPAARGAASASVSNTAPSTPYTVRLYDNYGTQQVQQTTTTPTLQLLTGGLPTGLYLLHIEAGGVIVERRRIQITH